MGNTVDFVAILNDWFIMLPGVPHHPVIAVTQSPLQPGSRDCHTTIIAI